MGTVVDLDAARPLDLVIPCPGGHTHVVALATVVDVAEGRAPFDAALTCFFRRMLGQWLAARPRGTRRDTRAAD